VPLSICVFKVLIASPLNRQVAEARELVSTCNMEGLGPGNLREFLDPTSNTLLLRNHV